MAKKDGRKRVKSGLPGPLDKLMGDLDFAILTPTAQVVVYTSIVVALILTIVLGGSYMYGQARAARFTSTAPGKMIDMGGYSMHLDCRGKGAKTVVFDSDFGRFSADWLAVREGLEGKARVCVYDRSGLGWSEPVSSPSAHISRINDRFAPQMATELYYALRWAGEKGPFVLVGEGMGALVAQSYAARFGGVSAMVLIDPYSTDLAEDESWLSYWEQQWRDLYWSWIGSYIGFVDIAIDFDMGPAPLAGYDNLDAAHTAIVESSRGDFTFYRARIEEYGLMGDSLKAYAKSIEGKPKMSIPVTTISRETLCKGASAEANSVWAAKQASFGSEYAKVQRVTVPGSDHMIPVNQPKVVIEQVAKLL